MNAETFQRILKEGRSKYHYAHILLLGPFGAGKTSLKERLRGNAVPPMHVPTDGLDSRIGCQIDITQFSTDWLELSSDIHETVEEGIASTVAEQSKKMKNVIHSDESIKSVRMGEEMERLLQKASEPNAAEDHKGAIFIWDFGGQHEYTSLHPMFIRSDCLSVLVYDLKKLQDQPHYFQEIEYWLQLIQSSQKIATDGSQSQKVILVGTHRDELEGDKQKRAKELIDEFEAKLSDKKYKCLIYDHLHYKLTDDTLEEFKESLGEVIQAGSTWGKDRPLSYMRLLTRLYKGPAIVQLQEIKHYASHYGITSESDVKDFLDFHHLTGDLTYFSESLNENYAIVNSQWLANVVTAIITTDYHRERRKEKGLNQIDLERLKNEGLVKKESMSLFDHLWKDILINPVSNDIHDLMCRINVLLNSEGLKNEGLVMKFEHFRKVLINSESNDFHHKSDFLKNLMCQFNLMFLNEDGDYMIPCMLKKTDNLLQQASSTFTIYLRFHASRESHEDYRKGNETYDKFLPPALFPQLICVLANKYIKSKKRFRNLFSFIDGDHKITLATNSTWISISLEYVEKEKAKEFLNEVSNDINALIREFYCNTWYEYCIIPCDGKKQEVTEQCITSTGVSSISGKETARLVNCQIHEESIMKTGEYDFWFGKCFSALLHS